MPTSTSCRDSATSAIDCMGRCKGSGFRVQGSGFRVRPGKSRTSVRSSPMIDKSGLADRRNQARRQTERWQSALTEIAPNKILIRGYPVDEMMGRLGFAEAVYLLLMGELPTPAIGSMLNAVLVS